jgi:hypothetical protein
MKRKPLKHKTSCLIILCIALLQAASLCAAKGSGEDERRGFEVNSPQEPKRMLIAAGPEDGCEQVLMRIVNYIKAEPVYIRVTGLYTLSRLAGQRWDAVVVIHIYHKGQPPQAVEEYLRGVKEFSRILVIPFVDLGESVDVTTSASIALDLHYLIEANLNRLRALLEL